MAVSKTITLFLVVAFINLGLGVWAAIHAGSLYGAFMSFSFGSMGFRWPNPIFNPFDNLSDFLSAIWLDSTWFAYFLGVMNVISSPMECYP